MYENLNAEIARKGLKKAEIAKFLSISTDVLHLKIKGKKQFTVNEAFKLFEILGSELSIEYLFNTQACLI